MILVELSLAILAVGLIYGVLTQIITPSIQGKKLFPMFRDEAELRATLIELEQAESDHDLALAVETKARELLKTHTDTKEKEQNV